MFKKLKDKIAEEVKSSPQRIQQLTQTVTERIQNATSDESFFSIGEDDSSTPEPGFSNVSLSNLSSPQSGERLRRSSNSSIASDVSFLPRYESAANLYHMQSDLDVSASEIEDNVSTSSQLGHLSKEQIHAAFQKSQLRYHKYRGRYADLKNYYKELEKENGKIKQVLVETQDKALRRVAELREQCSLEQKAKAHLENALRLELDEKQYVIDTLRTKVDLLQDKNNLEKSEVLMNHDDGKETLANDLKAAQSEIENLNSRLQEMKANAIVFASKESDLKRKIAELEETGRKRSLEMDEVVERERENNLIIAQTKMELHTEIQNRDLEIQNLKHDLEVIRADLDSYENKNKSTKLENLHSQNTKLIEKIEALTQKCKNHESELLKLEQLKIENETSKANEAKLREEVLSLKREMEEHQIKFDQEIATYREDTKRNLLTLEAKIREKVESDRDERELRLQNDFEDKLRQVTETTQNDHETRLQLLQKEDELRALLGAVEECRGRLKASGERYDELEKNHLELIAENSGTLNELKNARKRLSELEAEVPKQRDHNVLLSEKVSHMETEISNLHSENLKLSTEANDFQEKLLNAQSNVSSLKSANLTYEQELEKLQREKSQMELQIEAATVLQNEIVELNQFTRSPTDLSQTEFKNGVLNELKATVTTISSLEDRVRQLTELNSALEEEMKRSSVDDELKKVKQEFQRKIKEQKAKFHADVQNLNVEVAAFREKNEEIQLQVQEYKRKLSEYEEESSRKTVELQELTEEIAKLKDHLRKSEEAARVLADEKEGLSVTLRQKGDETLNLTNRVDELLEEKAKLVSDRNAIVEEKGRVERELDEARHKIAQLRSSEEEHEKRISHLQDDHMITLQQEIAKFKMSESNYNEEKLKLTNENCELLNINDELKRKMERYEGAQLELEKKLKKSEEDLEQLTVSNGTLNDRIDQFRSDLEALKGEKAKLEKRCSELQDGNQLLQEDLQRLKQNEALMSTSLETNAQISENYNRSLEEVAELKCRNQELARDFTETMRENDKLVEDLADIKLKYETILLERETWKSGEVEKADMLLQLQEAQGRGVDTETLKTENERLRGELEKMVSERELEELKNQLRDLENQFADISHERQLLREEIQELKISPINVNGNDVEKLQKDHETEINHLNDKLIQYKSLDLTNRTSIQFYENELQKLKNKNEKLNRKLDETLVTLNHCTDLATSTETEYLRNVLYNYMLGKESLVLARVIAAVCKFDDHQTEAILQREQQKQTLLGQFGFR